MVPTWYIVLATIVLVTMFAIMVPPPQHPSISVAFVGNSMQYFNDFPRFMEALSGSKISQNSCLHGGATVRTLLNTGNGMAYKFNTANAVIEKSVENEDEAQAGNDEEVIFDFGACSVRQLVFGEDSRLPDQDQNYDDYFNDDDDGNNGDNYINDGTNPCFEDRNYADYLENWYDENPSPEWNYIVLNDNTRSPARSNTRKASLSVLEEHYVPWLNQTGTIAVFLCTYAYWSDWRDMTGLVDVPTFTSLTYVGYVQYAQLLASYLPSWQVPRVAPVGIAFLTVWEENLNMWQKLFHMDGLHCSPYGTFLQGCVVYYTLYGRMPHKSIALRDDMSALWFHARRMQPPNETPNPFPSREEAEYLYRVAERVSKGHRPRSFIEYRNGEAADYVESSNNYYEYEDQQQEGQ